ncbi:CAAX protease [Hymenobacter amundsenii]|uniref:CAAX protease n=1 Tax=Hymenobacter amundsenii TaxID=2006685 RepID=A0A246FGI3_9BACT|nr:CAAX protease [Hymenobacter amundsenii]
MQYIKPARTLDGQVALLRERGLTIDDEDEAKRQLANINYYRLASYLVPLQADKETRTYKVGTCFETALELYRFDQQLRVMVFDLIERIEVSVRTRFIYTMSLNHSPWWFEDATLFTNALDHAKSLVTISGELERSHEDFIKSHRHRYPKDGRLPPVWKTLEIVTLGTLSRLYGNLRQDLAGRDEIAAYYLVPPRQYFSGWLQSLTQVRNICAHHARLWNRVITAAPKHIKRPQPHLSYGRIRPDTLHKLYPALCVINHLLFTVAPDFGLSTRLADLFAQHPNVDPAAMGFPIEWREHPLWQ